MASEMARLAPEVPGIVIQPRGSGSARIERIESLEVLGGSHPVPDGASFAATARLLTALRDRRPQDLVLLLLSGGASALLARPARGLRSIDKLRLGRLLLRSGLDIERMNAVRKHVSAVKGCGLLRIARPRTVVTLAISDVVGDARATIGSGPAVADPSTFADAWDALRRQGLLAAAPPRVRQRLERGAAGGHQETVKPGDALLAHAHGSVIGSNQTAIVAAARHARRQGYEVAVLDGPLVGEAAKSARAFARRLPRNPSRPTCVIAGGETTVRVSAPGGRGGRSQELALAAARPLARTAWTLLAAGTDGIDGNTPAAGAFVDGGTWSAAGRSAIQRTLEAHDAYSLLARLGDLFVTGPTGTNVMDLVIAVGGPSPTRRR
jgi:glycerate-2-kinase